MRLFLESCLPPQIARFARFVVCATVRQIRLFVMFVLTMGMLCLKSV